MGKPVHHTFETPEQLHAWLRVNHANESELWVRIYKKATGQPSVTWDDCVVAAIAWGWIDGLRKALDETSFLQRAASWLRSAFAGAFPDRRRCPAVRWRCRC